MKNLLTITAVIELGAGLVLMLGPSLTTVLLVGLPLEGPAALTAARVGGAGVFTLGVACSLARGDAQSRAARGLVTALLLYNVVVAGILAFAGIGYRLHGVALWPGVILHGVMAVWCVACLARRPFGATIASDLRHNGE